jgi:hypothetical protein
MEAFETIFTSSGHNIILNMLGRTPRVLIIT